MDRTFFRDSSPVGAIIAVLVVHIGCSPAASFDAITVPPASQLNGQAFQDGRRILQESQQSYGNIESYQGRIDVTGTVGDRGGKASTGGRSFDVEFRNQDALTFKGEDSNGDPFAIFIENQTVDIKFNGDTERLPSAEHALYAYSGITWGGSLFLPGCLLDIRWKNERPDLPQNLSFLTAWATQAELVGTSRVGDEECHRVLCERDTGSWTIYVSKADKLLRRVDASISKAQLSRLSKRGWGVAPWGPVTSSERSYTFRITKIIL